MKEAKSKKEKWRAVAQNATSPIVVEQEAGGGTLHSWRAPAFSRSDRRWDGFPAIRWSKTSIRLVRRAASFPRQLARPPRPLDFQTATVRPILSDNCFKCHGFDDRRPQGEACGSIAAAIRPSRAAKSGDPAIVPSKPD